MPDYSTMAPGVYLEEVSGTRPISGVGTALAAFVGHAEKGPNRATLIANWSQFVDTFGGISEGMALGRSVHAYFANGGGACVVVRVGGGETGAAQVASATLATAEGTEALVLTARQPGDAGNQVTVEVSPAAGTGGDAGGATGGDAGDGAGDDTDDDTGGDTGGDTGVPPPGPGDVDDSFDLVLTTSTDERETFEGLTTDTALAQLRTSTLVTVTPPATGGVLRPADGSTTLAGGDSGEAVTAAAFLGDEAQGTGLAGLIAQDEVTMVAAPDLVTLQRSGAMTPVDVAAVQAKMIDHCDRLGDRMVILDPPYAAEGSSAPLSPQDAAAWRDSLPGSKFATVYYPWVQALDPLSGRPQALPPSGFIAGAWARNDSENGVGSAPVGRVRGVIGLSRSVIDAEQGLLNPQGVNCLRTFRGQGVLIWGARTLSPDSEWKYVNVRRLFNFIEESVLEGTRFAVFQPNDRDLWARLRRSVEAFLLGLWRDGALVGATPEQAFFVLCNEETNPPDRIDQGIVTLEIGAAPVKPAEFVVIRVRQSSDSSSVSE